MKKITRRLSKLFLLFSLSTFVTPVANSHDYWGDNRECDDIGHSTWNKNMESKIKGAKYRCYDIPKGKYKAPKEKATSSRWDTCKRGYYCPGGAAGRIRPDRYSIAPDSGMSEPESCGTNKISSANRRNCSYPQTLSVWDELLDTKPKGSKYKDGRLVCKKGKNYSKQKGICR